MKNFNDDYGMRNTKEYIFTNENRWFIGHFINENRAKQQCPEGYTVNLYTTTKQIPI